jgi:hypothetical protein
VPLQRAHFAGGAVVVCDSSSSRTRRLGRFSNRQANTAWWLAHPRATCGSTRCFLEPLSARSSRAGPKAGAAYALSTPLPLLFKSDIYIYICCTFFITSFVAFSYSLYRKRMHTGGVERRAARHRRREGDGGGRRDPRRKGLAVFVLGVRILIFVRCISSVSFVEREANL